jgi:oligo-alginate lyase
VTGVIAKEGAEIQGPSFNKEQWHLALLRSGSGADERAVWLDYDTGGRHGHADGMNIGLFAKGLDLMPDFGYPPVQYGGGWAGPKAIWYRRTPAHNTVVIDGRDQKLISAEITGGRTTLWGLGEALKAIRVSGPEVAEAGQFERTVALIDVSKSDSYILDLFRVAGGRDHARFLHSHFGSITTSGLALEPWPDDRFGAQMRAFRGDAQARPGWTADWKIEDRYGYRPGGGDLHLRLTDLTTGAQAATAESWVSVSSGYDGVAETWIPTVVVRRQGEAEPLASTFVGIIEPYEGIPLVGGVRRLPLHGTDGAALSDGHVALEVKLADGRRDIIVSGESEGGAARIMNLNEVGLRTDAELALVRTGPDGGIERVALARGSSLEFGDLKVKTDRPVDFIEIALERDKGVVVGGAGGFGLTLTLKGKKIPL